MLFAGNVSPFPASDGRLAVPPSLYATQLALNGDSPAASTAAAPAQHAGDAEVQRIAQRAALHAAREAMHQGRIRDATEALARADDMPVSADALADALRAADLWFDLGMPVRARAAYGRLAPLLEALPGDDPRKLQSQLLWARLLGEQGRFADALALRDTIDAPLSRVFGADSAQRLANAIGRGGNLRDLDRNSEALRVLVPAMQRLRETVPPDDSLAWRGEQNLAFAMDDAGEHEPSCAARVNAERRALDAAATDVNTGKLLQGYSRLL